MSPAFSSLLNLSRWFSSLLVLVHHIRHIVFVDLRDVEENTFFVKAFYYFTGLGHEAVVVFFVLSGLLVGGLTFDKWFYKNDVNIVSYYVHRFSRIYIVLFPAIVFGYFLDNIGLKWFDNSELYTNSSRYNTISLNSVIKDNIGVDVLVFNMLMLQGLFVNVLGSNGPLWSLAYEWWYYCIWGSILGLIFFKRLKRLLFLLMLLFFLLLLPLKILLWMIIWLLGVVTYFWGKFNFPKAPKIISFLMFLLFLTLSRFNVFLGFLGWNNTLYIDFLTDFLLGVSYCILLVCFYELEGKNKFFFIINEKLASFSYSLYLIHFPLMIFLISILHDNFGLGFLLQPSIYSYGYFVILVLLLTVFGFIFSLFTERYTNKFIKKINNTIND